MRENLVEMVLSQDFEKTSLHTIAPYVGKLRPDVARSLIEKYSDKNDTIFDPFCGSGTVPLEAWIAGRKSIGVDLSYYAYVISTAKLSPYASLELAIKRLEHYNSLVCKHSYSYILDTIPIWIKDFFHPDTLVEIVAWLDVLIENNDYFFLAALLGILHHQRPGFLSYPSSHGAPYLRKDKYPIAEFPEMYEYRNVFDRLLKKIVRTYKFIPSLDDSIERNILNKNTLEIKKIENSTTIITSPPYMKSLTYARDNRMRLWFLGHYDWVSLDKKISIGKEQFYLLMDNCFSQWADIQKSSDYCIIVVGDILFNKKQSLRIPDMVGDLALKHSYIIEDIFDFPVNLNRKIIKTESQIKTEKICVFRRK